MLSNQQGIEEVFVIKSEDIEFFGAMIRKKGGESAVNGRVWFKDGTRWYFHSPAGNRDSLRRNLASLCEAIAASYGAVVYSLKFHRIVGYEEFIRLVREIKCRMAHA